MNKQSTLFPVEPQYTFAGHTYVAKRDKPRLTRQILAVFDVLKKGGWYTVSEIASITGHPETSISAQLRNLRKEDNGGYEVPRRNRNGTQLSEYSFSVADMANIE